MPTSNSEQQKQTQRRNFFHNTKNTKNTQIHTQNNNKKRNPAELRGKAKGILQLPFQSINQCRTQVSIGDCAVASAFLTVILLVLVDELKLLRRTQVCTIDPHPTSRVGAFFLET